MSDGARVPLAVAAIVADELIESLAPACERLEVGGSIRREVETIGDVELVGMPKVWTETIPDGMFGERLVEHDELAEAVELLRADGILIVHPDDPKRGERYSKLLHVPSGLQVDLFAVLPPATWGVIYLIRTGSASYSHWFVTECRRRGYHVKDGALHRSGLGCGSVPCEVIPTPEERDVYAATGIVWVPPHRRYAA